MVAPTDHPVLHTPRLHSERLELIACSAALGALAQGPADQLELALGCPIMADWLDDEARFLIGYYGDWAAADPAQVGWGLWLLRERTDDVIIGSAGFKGRPDWHGEIELGYGISPAYRQRGYASEAARCLVHWAMLQPQVRAIRAECLVNNTASRRVLEGLGMAHVGRSGDYDQWLLKR